MPKPPRLPGPPEPPDLPEVAERIKSIKGDVEEGMRFLESQDPSELAERALKRAQQRLDVLADILLRPVGRRRRP